MAALTAERNISRKGAASTGVPMLTPWLMAASTTIYKGAIVGLNASGLAVSGATIAATAIKLVGICQKTITSAASGSYYVECQQGDFLFNNHGADLVVQADAGAVVYAEDDNTVRKTSGGSTRSALGTFRGFDPTSGLPIVRVGNFSQTGV